MRTARSLTVSRSICLGGACMLCHACPLPHMPPCHATSLPHMPPAMYPLPCMPPCHTPSPPHMPPCHAPPFHACSPATHTPAMHAPCHAPPAMHPLPYMPPATHDPHHTHTPCHTHPPAMHAPTMHASPAMHASHHTCHPAMHAPPCEQNDWQTGVKTKPSQTSFAGGKYVCSPSLCHRHLWAWITEEKVMFSEATVSHSVQRGWESPPRGSASSLVLTSSGSHCNDRYASYWNAFLFYVYL